ncbi:MAG: helix-turn-helix transcriptional regulator [Eubacteriales bacterium]
MTIQAGQKQKLLYLLKILSERTDERHPLSIRELSTALEEYGCQAERKSIYRDIDMLIQAGYDIQKRKGRAIEYFLASRAFELAELKLLVDAVQSSRFITAKKSGELIDKLSSLTGRYEAGQLKRQVYISERPKNINETIYYSVDAIHTAIAEGKKISFRYFDYATDKSKIYRRDGEKYVLTPVALCWSEDNYYLIGYLSETGAIKHYRVDRITDTDILDQEADLLPDPDFDVGEYCKRMFGMFAGERVNARLRFDTELTNVVLGRFGSDIVLNTCENGFEVDIEVAISPVFLAWMFQFGARAQIVSPDSLRQAMKKLLDENINNY